MDKHLHIVSFDFPLPANYGGVIDVFYKLKSLQELGIKIHLHYFSKTRREDLEMTYLCESIHYYPIAKPNISLVFSSLPIRMLLRNHQDLLTNLSQDNHPILFEGLHTSFWANHQDLKYKRKFLRAHNAEAQYAQRIAAIEKKGIKKTIFYAEAKRTFNLEKNLKHFDAVLVLNQQDQNYFKNSNSEVVIVPAFHQNSDLKILPGKGEYVLFHGNLSVIENSQTANWILNELSKKLPRVQFKIAGKNPPADLLDKRSENVQIIANPDQNQMNQLIQNAQIILLKTDVQAGVKLKLIDSLALGRHIIADQNSIESTPWENCVSIANSTGEYVEKIQDLMPQEFKTEEIAERQKIFDLHYNNKAEAQKLIDLIFNDDRQKAY